MYHGFSVGFFWWWWWWLFFVSILFWGFFAILNRVAFKAVTGLMLKEDNWENSFQTWTSVYKPNCSCLTRSNQMTTKYHWKEGKKIWLQNSKSLASGHCDLKESLCICQREYMQHLSCWELLGNGMVRPPSPQWALLCSHGHVSPWSSVQSVSSPPFPLPLLLYLYCQETSFHLGLLCFVGWVLHYIMCLFLCVLWGCLEHN